MEPVMPRLCVFISNCSENYLRYAEEDKKHKYIRCDGNNILDPLSKFRVEKSKTNKDLVHIRCCYNNKYWRLSGHNECFIAAAADTAEEDQSKWSCTLFMPVMHGDNKMCSFRHVQSGNNVWYVNSDDEYKHCLTIESSRGEEDGDIFTITDWESLVMLPTYVAFKGDNGKYLICGNEDGDQNMVFGASKIGDNNVGEQIFTNPDGSIKVKHISNGKFWRATPNWICPDGGDSAESDLATLFWPVKLQGNAIALRSLANDRFLRRSDYGGSVDCLAAEPEATTVDKQSHLVVEELIKKREICNVKYRFEDAIVYDESVQTMGRSSVSNTTHQTEKLEVTLSYTQCWKCAWSTRTSKSSNLTVKLSAGIPKILDASIEEKDKFEGDYQLGVTVDKSVRQIKTMHVSVPPMTKMTVSLLATVASCDVPFSYSQKDQLINGDLNCSDGMSDGLYTGINCYKLRTETSQTKI